MALATLSIDLEARLARFEQGMARANSMLANLAKGATTSGQRVTDIFKGFLGAEVALEVMRGLAQAFPNVVNALDDLNDAADATGSTVEKLSALEDVARRNGATLDTVTTAVVKMNQVLKEADPDSPMARALKAIGLDAKELRTLDPSLALQRVAQALQGYADGGNKARLVQELFGKSARELAPFLKDLADAGKLNATVTSDQAAEAERFNKAMAELVTQFNNAARALAGSWLPEMVRLLKALNQGGVRGAVNEVGELVGLGKEYYAQRNFKILSDDVALLRLRVATQPKGAGRTALQAELDERIAELEAQEKVLRKLQGPSGRGNVNPDFVPGPTELEKPEVPKIPDAMKKTAASVEDYAQSLTKSIAGMLEQTDTVRFQEINDKFAKLQELSALGLDPKLVEDVQRLLSPPLGPNAGPPLSAEMERVNELLKQTDTAKLQQATRDVNLLREVLALATPNTERWKQLQDAVLEAETAVDDLSGAFKKVDKSADDTAKKMSETFEGALGDTFSRIFRGEFDSIGDMWKSLLIEMASKAVAADLMKALFGNGSGGGAGGGGSGGGSGGWLAAIVKLFLGSAKGNAFGASGLIPFASGGVFDSPTAFSFGAGRLGVMGEAGPEAVMPLRRGRDGRLGVAAAGGGSVVIHQTINVEAGASRNELMAGMTAAKNAAVGEILEMQRRGRWAAG